MALVPCTVPVAHRILDNAARTAGLPRELTAQVVLGLHEEVCGPPGDGRMERAERAEIERARTAPAPPAATALYPSPLVSASR
ncbi:hypothetical protein ACWGNM_05725 [Streptomyces sp. NPDC055796]